MHSLRLNFSRLIFLAKHYNCWALAVILNRTFEKRFIIELVGDVENGKCQMQSRVILLECAACPEWMPIFQEMCLTIHYNAKYHQIQFLWWETQFLFCNWLVGRKWTLFHSNSLSKKWSEVSGNLKFSQALSIPKHTLMYAWLDNPVFMTFCTGNAD